MPSYTAEELERATGFDRRTIAYYVQEGLIPKVGRRGPRTRYPQLIRDRLLFIRRVRDAEAAGEVPPVSLGAFRELFESMPPAVVSEVASGTLTVSEHLLSPAAVSPNRSVRRMSAPTRRAASDDALLESTPNPRASRPAAWPPPGAGEVSDSAVVGSALEASRTMFAEEPAASFEAGAMESSIEPRSPLSPASAVEVEIGQALAELQQIARRRREEAPRSVDTWSRIEIAPDIVLSVRGLAGEDADLLEKVGERLRQLISSQSQRRPTRR
jgi:hypothetical protein